MTLPPWLCSSLRTTLACARHTNTSWTAAGADRSKRRSHEAGFDCSQHCKRSISHSHLSQDARDLVLYRALGRVQRLGYLTVTQATRHEPQHFCLALRE